MEIADLHIIILARFLPAPQQQSILRSLLLHTNVGNVILLNQQPYSSQDQFQITIDNIFCTSTDYLDPSTLDSIQSCVDIDYFVDSHLGRSIELPHTTTGENIH